MQAEITLKPIVSPPTDDHFLNLDEVADRVLNGICDPRSD